MLFGWKGVAMNVVDSILNDLVKYEDLGFEDIPSRLQALVIAYDLGIDPRPPSESERLETVADEYEHRITNKEMTTKDYLNKYNINKETIR